jgi:hypothetical protein
MIPYDLEQNLIPCSYIPVWVYYLDKKTQTVRVMKKNAFVCKDKTLSVEGNACRQGGVHIWYFKPEEVNSAISLRKYPYRMCLTERNDELATQLFNKHLDRMTDYWRTIIESISTKGVEVRH